MTIAIWGASATAKTTIANRLASMLGVPLRSCGAEIRLAAKEADVSLTDAPEALHRSVDLATREWVQHHMAGSAVLEGRFLDRVLVDEPGVILVRAVCDPDMRVERWRKRRGDMFDLDDLAEVDKADDLFRRMMYGTVEVGRAAITLDTTIGEADNWAEAIMRQIAQ